MAEKLREALRSMFGQRGPGGSGSVELLAQVARCHSAVI